MFFFVLVVFVLNYIFSDPTPGPGVVTIYFETPFLKNGNTYIHYRKIPGNVWTNPPGDLMDKSDNPSFPATSWVMKSVESEGLEFVFDNGGSEWIHTKNGSNFLLNECGIYSIDKSLNVKTIEIFSGCLNNCSGHGTCDEGKCECDTGYYTDDCSKKCEDGEIVCDGKCYKGTKCPIEPLPGCEIYTDGKCSGDEIDMPPDFKNRNWQTPVEGSSGYRASYQSYSHLQGWVHMEYSSDHKSAVVEIKTITKDSDPDDLVYTFDGEEQSSSVSKFDTSFTKSLECSVKDSKKGYSLSLPVVDFLWNVPSLKEREGDYRDGQKGAVVEFFGWPDDAIEKECEVLSKAGYLGAKLFPHQESLMSVQPYENEINPWYFLYQPVSYRLEGRGGTRDDLRNLIKVCRSQGVRVYHDNVNNHMTGSGNDIQTHRNDNGGTCVYWPGKNSSDHSSPSPYFTQGFCFVDNENTELPPSQEFPAVPFGPLDFHCERPLNSWTSPLDLNAGWLVGLTDLHTGKDHVRERIADFWVDLLGIGFSGFRVDAFKHIQPDDWVQIIMKFKRNLGGVIPEDFFLWGELLVGGEHDMLLCDEESGYNFGPYFTKELKDTGGLTDDEINKIKLWSSWYPKEPEADCNEVDRIREVIQNDDHDQQFGGSSRDMGDKGTVLVVTKDVPLHRHFEETLFENPFGTRDNDNEWPIRPVLSSYWFTAPSGATTVPDGKSDCKLCQITCEGCQTVEYVDAYNASACGYDGSQGGERGYTLVHRDRSIILAMRKWMHLSTDVTNKQIGIPDDCK